MAEPVLGRRTIALTVGLIVLMWLFVTTGGSQIFVHEILGSAYDSQAEHFLRGDVGVDPDDIRHESMIVGGKTRMYFGPLPALVRMPLSFLCPKCRGTWSRLSGFCAAVIALVSFGRLVADALRKGSLSRGAREVVAAACLVGFVLASPLLLLLGNLSIYNEAVVWGFALSISALFFFYRCSDAPSTASPWLLFGFSASAAGALLSKVTFGVPLFLVAPVLLPALWKERRYRQLAALSDPLVFGAAFYILLSYARFGNFIGVNMAAYINSTHREFVLHHHLFNPARIRASFVDSFGLRFPAIQSQPPFLKGDRHFGNYGRLFSLNFSETYLTVFWASTWLVLGALVGLYVLFTRRARWFDRALAAACAVEALLVLSYFVLAERYLADFYPLLIVCLVTFLRRNGPLLNRTRYVLLALAIFSAVINSLTTTSWLMHSDMNVPAETRATWNRLLGVPGQ